MMIEDAHFIDFEWDEDKRLANFLKHNIDFVDTAAILRRRHYATPSMRNLELRVLAFCPDAGGLLSIVYIQRGNLARIISARRANRSERRKYQALFS